MKLYIKIHNEYDISFGELFDIHYNICVCHDELILTNEFYIPRHISENLKTAYIKFAKRMKMKVYSN